MSIINFPNNRNEECECPVCELVSDFVAIVMSAESPEELESAIRSLYEEAYDIGYTDALKQDVMSKIELIDHIEENCDCDEDCDC